MSTIVVLIAPFFVNIVTGYIKSAPTFASLQESRKPIIRLIAGLISFLFVTVSMWVNPDSVSNDMLQTASIDLMLTAVTWASSLGTYHAFFEKK
jgi:hypothetical protein